MALHFTEDETTLLLTLAQPIAPERRPQFLDAVAAELEASGQSGAGAVHRTARRLQRAYWDPPGSTLVGEPKPRGDGRH
jgi:hypothetical protein